MTNTTTAYLVSVVWDLRSSKLSMLVRFSAFGFVIFENVFCSNSPSSRSSVLHNIAFIEDINELAGIRNISVNISKYGATILTAIKEI